MKDQLDKIIDILTKAESEIQKVIIEAAQAGDYRSVDMARNAAVNVSNLRTQISNPSGQTASKATKSERRTKRKSTSRKSARTDYPMFQVTNDTLIRVGWSKKQRREYTHKTPKSVFDTTIKAMATLARGGTGPFSAEQIIERINKNSDTETIPSYQVYTVIGMLRQLECIKQIGREGYDISPELPNEAERKWSELAKIPK